MVSDGHVSLSSGIWRNRDGTRTSGPGPALRHRPASPREYDLKAVPMTNLADMSEQELWEEVRYGDGAAHVGRHRSLERHVPAVDWAGMVPSSGCGSN